MPYWYFLCWVREDDQAISKTLQSVFGFYLRFSMCGYGIISNFCSHKQDRKEPTIFMRHHLMMSTFCITNKVSSGLLDGTVS